MASVGGTGGCWGRRDGATRGACEAAAPVRHGSDPPRRRTGALARPLATWP